MFRAGHRRGLAAFHARLGERFGDAVGPPVGQGRDTSLAVAPERVAEVALFLRDEPELAFDCLSNLSGVDYPKAGHIQVVYHQADLEFVQSFWGSVFSGVASDEATGKTVRAIRNYLRATAPLLRMGGGNSAVAMLKTYDTLVRSYNRWLEGEPVERVVAGRQEVREVGDVTKSAA